MSVRDVPVHEKTKVGPDYRSGCHSMHEPKRKAGYMAKVGFTADGRQKFEWFDDVMSKQCRQTLFQSLPFCEGCTRPKDMEFIRDQQNDQL